MPILTNINYRNNKDNYHAIYLSGLGLVNNYTLNSDGTGTLTRGNFNIQLQTPYNGTGIIYLNEKIDFSKYSKLIISYSYTAGDASTSGDFYVGSTNTYPTDDELFTNTFITHKANYSGRGDYNQIIDLSAFSFSEPEYLKIRFSHVAHKVTYYIYNIILV